MQSLRAFIRDHRRLAILLVVLALCLKAIVPAGFMVSAGGKSLAITVCDGRGPDLVKRISIPQAGQAPDKAGQHGDASDACPYAALTMVALSGAQAALLAIALAFILTRGIWPVPRPQPAPRAYLRPPLRAPPLPG